MTDLYPDEEGYISDGQVIGYCSAQAAIELMEVVYIHGTALSGLISVAPAAADGDGIAVALKEAAAGDIIPVCFRGIVKIYAGDTITAGELVINDELGTYVLPLGDKTADELVVYRGLNYTGTIQRLGMALHGAISGDEILVLVGKIY